MAKKVEEEFPDAEVDPICVVMTKDDKEIPVHPVQVALWQSQGWTVVE